MDVVGDVEPSRPFVSIRIRERQALFRDGVDLFCPGAKKRYSIAYFVQEKTKKRGHGANSENGDVPWKGHLFSFLSKRFNSPLSVLKTM